MAMKVEIKGAVMDFHDQIKHQPIGSCKRVTAPDDDRDGGDDKTVKW